MGFSPAAFACAGAGAAGRRSRRKQVDRTLVDPPGRNPASVVAAAAAAEAGTHIAAAAAVAAAAAASVLPGVRGLHSSTFQLNLSRFGLTSPCPPV